IDVPQDSRVDVIQDIAVMSDYTSTQES
ncbi:hypothetical protein A2U01_0028920, partial [Trifolium medium]|nr:hypothetical protein [Trifolium medium]